MPAGDFFWSLSIGALMRYVMHLWQVNQHRHLNVHLPIGEAERAISHNVYCHWNTVFSSSCWATTIYKGGVMRLVGFTAAMAAIFTLTACGNNDNSKVEKVINEQLAKSASCTDVPIGQKVDYAKIGADGALGILKAKGYITESQGTSKDFFGRTSTFETFALTDRGKPLVQRDGFFSRSSCIRTGHFAVTKIEAIDIGNDAEGKPVASVRAKIEFVPEEWIAGTRNVAAWSGYWKDISETENSQWLYTLLKSGSDYYSHGPGRRLK